MIRLLASFPWVSEYFPFGASARVGSGLGVLLHLFAGERRDVAWTNIRSAFRKSAGENAGNA